MKPADLQIRTKTFALRVIKVAEFLQRHPIGKFIANQIFRSSTSVAANYRAACRARSAKDFIAKLGIVIEEVDETAFWLELSGESGFLKSEQINDLFKEANEITAIMVASKNSAIKNQRRK